MKKEVLFIAGNSGSGKSYLTKMLMGTYPGLYLKLEQYTTRLRRTPDEKEYYYVNDAHFNIIKDKLIANTIVNGKHYGTIPTLEEGKIAIIIVNALGLENGINYCKAHDIEYRVVFLLNDTPFETREDFRDIELESQEILDYLKYSTDDVKYEIVENDSSNPISVEDLHDHIDKLFKR